MSGGGPNGKCGPSQELLASKLAASDPVLEAEGAQKTVRRRKRRARSRGTASDEGFKWPAAALRWLSARAKAQRDAPLAPDEKIGSMAVTVLLFLTITARNETGYSWWTKGQMARALEVSPRALRYGLQTLEAAGLIESTLNIGRGQANRYRLAGKIADIAAEIEAARAPSKDASQ